MKKLLLIPLLLLTVLSMAACGGGDDEPFRPGQPETPEQPGEKEDGEPETPDVSSLNVNITVGDRTVTATMEDNAAARDFLSRLPLEITLNDYNNMTEKIFYPDPALTTEGVTRGCAPTPGDITIYAPWGNVAIFCKSWSHSNALIKIGRIDGNGIDVKTCRALDTEEIHRFMDDMSNEARRITFRLNTAYHTQDEVRGLLSELFGYEVPESLRVFPPFYADFGKNITVGEGVFINACCHFQDQGGVTIGDGCQIGHNVVFATLNHGLAPEERHTTYPAPIVLGKNVWIGSNATILQGVTIGDNVVIGAGAVVTRDLEANTVAAGVPAQFIKSIVL